MANRAKTFQEMAREYGLTRKTFAKYVYENEDVMEKLEENNWFPGQVLFPIHQAIINEFFGDTKEKQD